MRLDYMIREYEGNSQRGLKTEVMSGGRGQGLLGC